MIYVIENFSVDFDNIVQFVIYKITPIFFYYLFIF